MEKPGSFDLIPKGTGCTPWFFRISADNKLNAPLIIAASIVKKLNEKVEIFAMLTINAAK